MNAIPPTALSAAFRLAPDGVAAGLAERIGADLHGAVATRHGLPEALVARVLAEAGVAPAEALDGDAWARLALAAAGLGDPGAAVALYTGGAHRRMVPDAVRAAVLAAADPADRRWYDEGGLVPFLLATTSWQLLRHAADGPFPDVLAHILSVHGAALPRSAVLSVAARYAELTGAAAPERLAAAAEAAASGTDDAHPGLSADLRAAAADGDPAGVLRAGALKAPAATPAEVDLLMALRSGMRAVGRDADIGTGLARDEHARLPFGDQALRILARMPGCPGELALAVFRSLPHASHETRQLPFEVLTGEEARERRFDVGHRLQVGVRDGGYPVERVLAEVAPAHLVIGELPLDVPGVRAALRALVEPLGDDPALWLTLYTRLPRVAGPAPDLIADVLATGRRPASWPRPMPAKRPAEPPENSRAPFNALLACASEAAQIAVLPALDERALQHLLVYGEPSRAVLDAAIAVRGPQAHRVRATHDRLTPDVLAELLDAGDPVTDANLFSYGGLPPAERRRILAGIGRADGRTRPVPEEVLREMRETNLGHYRGRLLAGIGSGDPGVATVLVTRVNLRTEQARLRVIAAVWERHGPDAARAVAEAANSFPATTRRRVTAALEAGAEGLATLRAALEHERSPEAVTAFLRKNPSNPDQQVARFRAEGGEFPWEGIVALHRERPLPPALVAELTEVEGCPAALVRDYLAAPAPRRRPDDRDRLERLLRRGAAAPADVLAHARPAAAALDVLTGSHGVRVRRAAMDLTTRHLGDDPEAWVIALRLIDGFTGTLPELAATAGAVAGR